MHALIHQRRILQMLIRAPLDRVDAHELRVEVRPALPEEVIAVPQPLAQRRRVVVDDRVGIQRVVVPVPLREHRDDLAEKVRALPSAPRHAFEVQPLDVVLLQESEHVLLPPILRDVIPRRLVDLREPRHHVERDRLRPAHALLVARHIHGIVREGFRARRGEVEEILEGLRRVRFEPQRPAVRRLAAQHRQRALRDLQQQRELLRRRRGIRHHDIRAIDHAREKFPGHVFVELLIALLAIPVAVPVEILRHQQLRVFLRHRRRFDLLVESDERPRRRERELPAIRLRHMLRRLKRQIEHRQRQHHFGKIPRRFREVRRDKRHLPIPRRIVAPEGIDRDQIRLLLRERELVVIVLRPLLRRPQRAEKRAHQTTLPLRFFAGDEPEVGKILVRSIPFCALFAHQSLIRQFRSFFYLGLQRLHFQTSGIFHLLHRLLRHLRPAERHRASRSHRHRRGMRCVRGERSGRRCGIQTRDSCYGHFLIPPEFTRLAQTQRTPTQRCLEEFIITLRIGWPQFPQFAQMPRRRRRLGGHALREQAALGHVQPRKGPGLEVALQVPAEQVVIHEGLILLVAQIRGDHLLEKRRVFLREEKAQFVAGKLGILRPLLLVLERRPLQHPREFRQLLIAAQRGEKRMHPGQRIVSLQVAREDVRKRERLAVREHGRLLLFREGLRRIEIPHETQVLEFRRHLRQRQRAPHRVRQILRVDLHLLPVAQRLPINPHHALLIRREIEKHRRSSGEKVEVCAHLIRHLERWRLRRCRTCCGRILSSASARRSRRALHRFERLREQIRRAHFPRIQYQAWPREHVAGKELRVAAF